MGPQDRAPRPRRGRSLPRPHRRVRHPGAGFPEYCGSIPAVHELLIFSTGSSDVSRHDGDTAHVGLCEVTLRLHMIESLKEKRAIRNSLITRLRNRFNVSASEIRFQDSKTYLGVTFVSVSSSRKVIDSEFNEILQRLESDGRFIVEHYNHTYL